MGALTHNGEVLQSLPANASQINFDKTGTDLNATQTENAIKEVNTKVNTNADDIDQLKSGLTNTNNLIGTLINTMYDGQSIDLDNPTRTTLGLFNGDNITGTKPFTIAGGIGHVVMVFHSNPDIIIEIIMSPYESKMGMRVKEYNQGAWIWQAWKVATFQSVS